MPHVIQLQINPPVYLAGLDPALHRTFRRDHALVFMTLPSSDQVKHCTDHFPEAHVVEVQPAPAAEKRASAYYAIKLNETEYYDGDPRRWTIPSSDNPNSAALFAQFIWAESIAKSLQDRWTGAHVVPAPGMVEVQPEPEQVKAAEIKDIADAYREALRMVPVEFREFGDTLDSRVAKLAKAYEETKLKAEFLAQGNQEWSDQVAALQEEIAQSSANAERLHEKYSDAYQLVPDRFIKIGDVLAQSLGRWLEASQNMAVENAMFKAQHAAKPEPVAVDEYDAREDNVIEELENIIVNGPVEAGDLISHDTGQELIKRGLAYREYGTDRYAADLRSSAAAHFLARHMTKMRRRIQRLQEENAKLNTDLIENTLINDGLHRDIDARTDAITQIKDDRDRLLADRNSLLAENTKLKAQIAAVDADHRMLFEKCKAETDEKLRLMGELEDIGAIIADELDLPCESATHREILRRRLRHLAAKPEPVADAEIARVLEEMRGYRRGTFAICGRAVQNWHDTLQAVGADLVIARESLEQVTKVKDEMRDGRDSAVKVMRALTEELAQFKVTLEAVTKERDALHATEGMLVQDLDDAIKERDDARTALDDARDRLKLMTNMRIGAEKDRDYCQSKRIEAEKERDDALSKLETIRKLTEEAP